jgi:RAD51-like protein 3
MVIKERYSTSPFYLHLAITLVYVMKLSALVPPLPAELALSLGEQCGLRTESDLLFAGSHLDVYRRLLPTTHSLYGFNECIRLVTEKAAAPADRADESLAAHAQGLIRLETQNISSGIPSLDTMLNFGATRMLEISGDRGSGKTVRSSQLP